MGMMFWLIKNKRFISLAVLGILITVLGIVVYVQYFSRPAPPGGALRVVKCADCGDKSVKLIMKDINDKQDPKCTCGKCGKKLGYAFKCDECDFEFPVIPVEKPSSVEISKMKTMGKFTYALQVQKCPNCGSIQTTAISVQK